MLALLDAGITVDALCPVGHSLECLKLVSNVYHNSALNGIGRIREVVAASRPDIIIPADDYTAVQLHKLYKLSLAGDGAGGDLRVLIARSIGDPDNYPVFYARDKIAAIAKSAGVPSPIVTTIHNKEQLLSEIARTGFPAVLKTDGSSGGRGVAIVKDRTDAKSSFRKLAYPSVMRALKRGIVDSDATLLLPSLRRDRARISIQRFIDGRQATAAVACWKGEVLAHVTVEVLASLGPTGPATVVRVIGHSGISQAVERMTRLLRPSGLCGFDFILDAKDGTPHLIDFNPRATQTAHLVSSDGKQPTAWLAAQLRGMPFAESVETPHCKPIVLFPHGFLLGPKSPYSQYANSDVPANSPELVDIGLEFQRKTNRLLVKTSKMLAGFLTRPTSDRSSPL